MLFVAMNRILQHSLGFVLVMALLAIHTTFHRKDTRTSAMIEPAPAEALDVDAPLFPRDRPDFAAYSARTEGDPRTAVFVQAHENDIPKVVYVDPEPGELIRISNDGARGIFRRYIAPGRFQDMSIHLLKHPS